MALRARRSGATAPAGNEVQQDVNTQAQAQPEVQQQAAATPPPAAPPVQQSAPIAPPANTGGKVSEVAALNGDILEGFEDLTGGGNYVTVDGTDFLYKDSNETASEIEMVIASAKRYYQWVDESDPDNKVFHDSPTKLDNRYKLKAEIRWYEEIDGEAVEYIMGLSTTSAIQFINYIQALAKKGTPVNKVVTKATISRHQRKGSTDRYSRVDFTEVGAV